MHSWSEELLTTHPRDMLEHPPSNLLHLPWLFSFLWGSVIILPTLVSAR